MVEKKISNKFRWFSLVMTIMIVCYHVAPHFLDILIQHKSVVTSYVYHFYETFGQYGLIYFFGTSGYFFAIGKDDFDVKMKKRVRTLLIPYLAWNVLYLLFFLATDRSAIVNMGITGIVVGITIDPYDNPLWYISVLFIYFLISIPFMNHLKNCGKFRIFSIVLILIIIIFGVMRQVVISGIVSFPFDYCVERFFRFIPAYLFGVGYSQGNMIFSINKKICIFGFLLTFVIAIIFGDSVITVIALYFSSFFLWNMISAEKLVDYNDVSLHINTFVVYALHDMLIRILLALTYRLTFNIGDVSLAVAYFLPIMITIIIIGICIFATGIIEKFPFTKKVLTGGR